MRSQEFYLLSKNIIFCNPSLDGSSTDCATSPGYNKSTAALHHLQHCYYKAVFSIEHPLGTPCNRLHVHYR